MHSESDRRTDSGHLAQTVSTVLAASASPSEGLARSAELLSGYTQAEAVQISALSIDGERVVEIFSSGNLKTLFPSGLRRPSHGSSMRAIANRGSHLYTKDELTDGSKHGVEDFTIFLAAGYSNLIAAPVHLHGTHLGAIQLLSSSSLSQDSIRVLGETVPLLAPYVALYMSRIESAVEDRISVSIERVAQAVIEESGIEGVGEAVVKFAKGSMGIDAAVLRIKDSANGQLRIEYRHGHLDPAEVAGKAFSLIEQCLIPIAAKREGPMIFDEGSPEVFNDEAVVSLLDEIPSILITPLLDRGELLGTMEFYSLNEYAYKAEHLRNVEHVANLLTSAVEHFRLIRSLSREAEIRSLLAEVARLASAEDDLVSLVASISPELRKVIPVDRVTYFMPPERFQAHSINDQEAAGDSETGEVSLQLHAASDEDPISGIVVAGPDNIVCTGSGGKTKPTCGAAYCIAAKLWDDAEDRPQGWIHLERASEPFTVEERGLVPEFARHISPAIDTALSHEAELRVAQEQLRAERAEAEVENQQKLNEAKQNFIATMSHELRTPLTSIRAFTDLLNRDVDGSLSEKQKKQLAVVRRNSEWLNILINDLLDLSSIDSGRFELQYQEVEVATLVEGLMESFGPIAEVAGHKLEAILPRRTVKMMIDPNRFSQVLGNLLTNAMKYSPEGTGIRLLARPVNGGVSFFIRDEGPGIPPKQQKLVFERFVRAKSEASKRARGTGIGLYVSKMIVEGHGGHIGVTSKLDSHTTMAFWLPCQRQEGSADVGKDAA